MLTDASIIRIPPHHYIHVLDQNTNIARVEIGPLTYIRQDNERSEECFSLRCAWSWCLLVTIV
uniref:Major vault protein n=1 Tax=Neolamprologus brichardi TaxID=32507 RepID=A0A3Q4HY28_NEOBR